MREPPRTGPSRSVTVLAVLVIWVALLAPSRVGGLGPAGLLRIPIEGLAFVALVLTVGPRTGRVVSGVLGGVLGLLTLVAVLDIGLGLALHRTFDPLTDPAHAWSAAGLLTDSVGRPLALLLVAAAVLTLIAILLGVPLSALRLATLVSRHRTGSVRVLAALSAAWVSCALLVAPVGSDGSVAAAGVVTRAVTHLNQVRDGVRERQAFTASVSHDPLAAGTATADDLLAGLRGKDVLIVFVESYGRVAVQDSHVSTQVGAALDAGTARLAAAGFSTRSAFLTSPTFGGLSWLAHSTLQSGLRVDTQQRYDQLIASNRLTLSAVFHRAGWRTVCDIPANQADWPPATSFYRCDRTYDSRSIGYAGPAFGYAPVPDQFTLAAFARHELTGPRRAPVMAEIDLVSSHAPWAPLPRILDWTQLGDGSAFHAMAGASASRDVAWRDPDQVRTAYGQAIVYSLDSIVSFVESVGDDNLVMVVLGDHQPSAPVSDGTDGHDVPVTLIAHDASVLDRISGWGWHDGMRPEANAPVWPMDSFRGRFVAAYAASTPAPG